MIIPSEASLPGFNLLCSLLPRPLSPLKLGLDMRLLYAVDVKKKGAGRNVEHVEI